MRIYCDSNIFRKAKRSSPHFNPQLCGALECLTDAFLYLFSEAHLQDLHKSEPSFREQDLKQMELYVKNNYLYRDAIKKEFHYYLATPTEAYEGVDFDSMSAFFERPRDYIRSSFDFEGGEELGKLVQGIFDLPIFAGQHFDLGKYENHELLKGFESVRSINDALSQMQGFDQVLDSKSQFKKYKALISEFINRDSYSYETWSFNFDKQMKDTVFGKSFRELVDLTIADSEKNDEYTRFINTYTNLEFYGVTQEKTSGGNLKKNSFWDIHKDANHAYYASKADFLVSDDNGMLTKAFIAYKLLDIKTEVLSSVDFINKAPSLLRNEDNIQSFLKGIGFTLKNGFVIRQSDLGNTQLVKLTYPVLNYFNRLQVNTGSEGSSLNLFKSGGRSGWMYAEIELLVAKCNRLFGPQLNLSVDHEVEEYSSYQAGDTIRTWLFEGIGYTLSIETNSLAEDIIVLNVILL